MAELEISGSHEEQWGVMKSAVQQLHATIYGNGQPGILDFVSGTRAQFRLIVVLLSAIGVGVAVLGYLQLVRH